MKESGGFSSTRARISPAQDVDAAVGAHAQQPEDVALPEALDALARKARGDLGREGRFMSSTERVLGNVNSMSAMATPSMARSTETV